VELRCNCLSHSGFLTRRGYLVAQQYSLEGLSPLGVDRKCNRRYLDKVGSVSALAEAEEFFVFDDQILEEQYLRGGF